jgi:cephalosporin-C deacetylase-like acetyl esterase
MKKITTLACAVLLLSASALAENYPYRSDDLWVTVPNHSDWIYTTGQNAKVEVQFYKYGIPQAGATVSYELSDDMMSVDKTGTVTLNNQGRAEISVGTMKTPGFRDCKLQAVVDGVKYQHHIKVGFSPEKIQPYTKMPADFQEFWNKNLDELKALPLSYTKELAPQYCTDKIDCYLVKLNITKKQAIYGYLFYPKNAAKGQCPVVLCPPGAGIKTIKEPLRHKYYPENGCIRFEIEIHGLNPEMTNEQFDEISRAFNGNENGYLTNGLDNRDNYYMKRVYLGCVRAIDLLTSLPEWDGKNVIVQGGSQGGALALITAGLDKRVTACVANHPALSDMAGYKADHAGGYPHFFRVDGMDTPDKLKTMAYYDVVNFARLITVPTYMTWGYNDNTCPPTTSYAVYNLLTCPKEALITPINEHWTSDATERGHLTWILNHLNK